jgi:hypothetical protein
MFLFGVRICSRPGLHIRIFDSVKAVFEQKKDRKTGVKSALRFKVTPKVQMSNSFIEDCKKIVALKDLK